MSNRPHSREKRVSDNSSRVETHSFSEQGRAYGGGNRGTSNLSNAISIIALLASLFGRKNNNQYGGKRKSLFGTIIKIAIILIVLYYVFNFVSSLLGGFSSSINNSVPVNTYVENHNQTYNQNVGSDEVNYNVSSNARDKYTKIIGNNKDEVTVMVYMIGTDLESSYGCATSDLQEIYYSGMKDNINVVVQTGGCNKWNNNFVSNRTIQRYAINSEGALLLQDNIGNEPMTEPEVLSDFIRYASNNFPANRYMLVLWDHGGGSVTGYGYDEKFPYAGSMSPDKIAHALKNGGIKFDMVGFDACLMANLETAIAIEPYADYMVASEETEPGAGWDYTNWIKAIDSNTSIPTVELGKIIIDDYVSSSKKQGGEITESLIDLGELVANVKEPLKTFSKATANKLNSNNYQSIATARSNTKEFSRSSRLDQVDLVDLATKFNVDGSKDLIKAIRSAVKYNKTYNINNAYGLSAYFPYSSLSKMNEMVKIYDNINMDEEYASVVKSFASFASSGQIVTQNGGNSANSIFDVLMGDNYYSSYDTYSSDDIYSILNGAYGSSYGNSYSNIFGGGYDDWLQPSMLDLASSFFGRGNIVDSTQLNIINKDGQNVVSLQDSQWELIDNVQLNMFVDDGRGYIDLGKDNVFDWNEDGDLIVDSDGTWLSLIKGDDTYFVSYYMVSDEYIDEDNYKTIGRIPAYLNGDKVDIMVSFTPEYPYGHIDGAKLIYEDSDVQQKGLIEIENGDQIKFTCNYYTYDGELIDEYQLGNTYVVDGQLELYNSHIENHLVYTYCFKDIYGNNMWTPRSEMNY